MKSSVPLFLSHLFPRVRISLRRILASITVIQIKSYIYKIKTLRFPSFSPRSHFTLSLPCSALPFPWRLDLRWLSEQRCFWRVCSPAPAAWFRSRWCSRRGWSTDSPTKLEFCLGFRREFQRGRASSITGCSSRVTFGGGD